MKNILLYNIAVFLIILSILEILASFIFSEYLDDKKYSDMVFSHFTNSSVIFDAASENYSRKYGYRNSPNTEQVFRFKNYEYTVRTNSLGFRAKELEAKRENEYRVLLLGDSMFWGHGIKKEDMIDRVIERLGKSEFDDNNGLLSVYNYSVIGYNTVQELIVSREYSDTVRPDLIILGFFTGNDVIPNALTEIDGDGNIATNEEKVEYFKSELKRSDLFFRSAIFRVLAHYVYVPRLRNLASLQKSVISESYVLLKKFAKEARERGSSFAVVIIPTLHAVENGFPRYWTSNRPVGRKLYSFCKNHQIDVLDALDFMDGESASDRYFSSKHEHLTKDGAEIMGRNIYRRLILPHYEAQRRAGNKVILPANDGHPVKRVPNATEVNHDKTRSGKEDCPETIFKGIQG